MSITFEFSLLKFCQSNKIEVFKCEAFGCYVFRMKHDEEVWKYAVHSIKESDSNPIEIANELIRHFDLL